MYIIDFAFNGVNEGIEIAKDKDTNWVDWSRYCVGKVMNVLTFIPGVSLLLSFIKSGVDFLQGISQLLKLNKMNNDIRLKNANNEVY
jgi:hypothetical protein